MRIRDNGTMRPMGGRMRVSSVFLTAAIMMLGLVGAVALAGTTATAQEGPTRQTFETREIRGPEATPERTTQAPAPEQGNGEVQATTDCPGVEVLDTIGPTEDDLIIGPFRITGERFRLTYETTDADESGFPFFDVTVLDEAGREVGGRVIFEEGTQREVVGGGPGSFTIEARSEDLKYEITAEDCTGGGNANDGGQPLPRDPVPEEQYQSDVDPPNEDVIDDTISDEPLPDTGGASLLGSVAFGLICVFAAFALLRPVIRRNP
jgi:hypothetical protein